MKTVIGEAEWLAAFTALTAQYIKDEAAIGRSACARAG
jgi:hypothetical protein